MKKRERKEFLKEGWKEERKTIEKKEMNEKKGEEFTERKMKKRRI